MTNFFCFIFLGTLGWGISLSLIKILLPSLTPTEIVLYRTLIGAISLISIIFIWKIKIQKFRLLIIDGLIIGIFNMAIPLYLTSFAEKNISSALASIISGLTPLCTFLLGIFCFPTQDKFNYINILSILFGLLGIIIINYDFTLTNQSFIDIIALLLTCISYGIAANYLKYYAKTDNILLISAMAAVFTTFLMLIMKLFFENHSWNMPHSFLEIFSLLWLGVIGSGISLFLYFYLIQNSSAFLATMITYLITITGVIIAIVFLNETINNVSLIGCLCLIVSVLLINHFKQIFLYIKKMNPFTSTNSN